MTQEPSKAVRLFGTDEPAPRPRILTAGSLTAELDAGNLRHIRFDGVELIRAISFIVRDRNWGTYNPTIENLIVDETADGFTVTYDAVARDEAQAFRYSARISATTAGQLTFSADGSADTDFLTNRTGFVVLHPIVGVAGRAVRIEHADGTIEDGTFPHLIDPVQPMMNLRALTHEAAPGLSVTCRMDGDVYEMEDQRNWTDASYKTYVRPLALPWPYTLDKGQRIAQAVTLTVDGVSAAAKADTAEERVSVGPVAGTMPSIGYGLDPSEIEAARGQADLLSTIRPGQIICHYNPALGHDEATLGALVETARMLGGEIWLEAVVQSVDGFEAELSALGACVDTLGRPFATVLVSPAPDLKCTLPGSVWPDAPPPRQMFEAARRAFPEARIGGGMFSYFTEMNRKRPPADLLDIVSFTTTATLHAGDDHSIMEGLESLPAIADSARAIAAGKPIAVGPSAIGMRMNPYGDAPMANPANIRQAMNFNDPRQRGLLGAAWMLGYIARFGEGGASAITMGAPTGPFGLIWTPQDWPQPWYDEAGGLFPAFHVLRGLAALQGLPRLSVSHGDTVEALAVEGKDETILWIANRTGQENRVQLPANAAGVFMLDEDSFEAASRTPDAAETLSKPHLGPTLTLKPYAVARVRW
ncbi:hypothetical protein LA66_07820 [Aureimonas altamirensis]|uniref:Uncharacterized protein n=1 Tax=Aureimonas altamirensis TaxID=370622 RepID=A0A0B1Q7Q9_9HYPH|nr:hypothetical protein [Aureimonas altamirensis]KHJ56429.1 hypothetical protein LA66_07820 [Aureimonas altamirensis]